MAPNTPMPNSKPLFCTVQIAIWSLLHSPCWQPHCSNPKLKTKAISYFPTSCVHLPPAICKSCPLCSEHLSSIKAPSTCTPQEALPRPGWGVLPKSWSSPPHVHLPASQRHLIPLPTGCQASEGMGNVVI